MLTPRARLGEASKWSCHQERKAPGGGTGAGKEDLLHLRHRAFEEHLVDQAALLGVITSHLLVRLFNGSLPRWAP